MSQWRSVLFREESWKAGSQDVESDQQCIQQSYRRVLLYQQNSIERKAEEAHPPAQARTMKEINENLTILLGVTSSQGGDIKIIQEDTSSIKDRLDQLETQSNEHTGRFDHVEALLTQILARLPDKS